jgi:phosphate transport system permease protein
LTQLDGAQSDGTGFAVATLAELGLVLAFISVLVNLAARGIIRRSSALGPSVGPN